MEKPTIILATSNGVGMGHLARATAIALELREIANPIIVSMAGGIAEIPEFSGIRCEYIPGRDRGWMKRSKWDAYLRDRLLALANETKATAISFDGVVPYPGVIATKLKNPNLNLVWIRRGLWRKNPLRFGLPLQSKMMDFVIEPGDFAAAYDKGPTSLQNDALHIAPVSLYNKAFAFNRVEALNAIGLDPARPAVLVQLGTGENDANEKMRAALTGLTGWKDLQIVLTKEPKDKNGNSLVPAGLDVKVVRFFPLANVLKAFDAAICATGYNGVHELLPAQIPTVLVSNIRGTDDQEARAKWCNDFGFAIRADQANLSDITEKVRLLQSSETRKRLSEKCIELPFTSGAKEAAEILYKIATGEKASESARYVLRQFVYTLLRYSGLGYRKLRPHKNFKIVTESVPIWSQSTSVEELRVNIRGEVRFEHIIYGASDAYIERRKKIAKKAY
jgi:UDP:flavonoid glycosyltransferase YjiC (YdhE family)